MHFNLCDYEWVGIAAWWLSKSSSEQVAWIQAIGSILAIIATFFIANRQERIQQKIKEEDSKKIVMAAAATLYNALRYQSAIYDFAPRGDGAITYDPITIDQAKALVKLSHQTLDALSLAIDKSHYFSTETCESIVNLSMSCAAYDRIIENIARFNSPDTDTFFKNASKSITEINSLISEVKEKLTLYLPKDTR